MGVDIGAIAAAAAILGVLVWTHLWERNWNAGRDPTDPETLFRLARLTESSEYEQFRRAARLWGIADRRVETDFKRYLFEDRVPPYVRDYLRRAREALPELRKQPDPRRDPLLPPAPGPRTFSQ
jgi:hypothetical protein